MGFFSGSAKKEAFPWTELVSQEQLTEVLSTPGTAVFLLKHSTRCSISTMAKNRFERDWEAPTTPFQLVYLDLLNHRDLSARIEELTGVVHQSPQLIVWKDGKVIYHNSHNAINAKESIEAITN